MNSQPAASSKSLTQPHSALAGSALALQWTRTIRDHSLLARLLTELALVLGGVCLLVMLTQVRIPMAPVPITGQTLGILLIGAALGWQRGAITVLAYYQLGILGAPVFAGGLGPATFAGPTGGFLISFLPAVIVVGLLAEQGWVRRLDTALLTFLIGHTIIFAIGVIWLAMLIGASQAIQVGLIPFIPGMLVKTVIAAILLPLAWAISGLTHPDRYDRQ